MRFIDSDIFINFLVKEDEIKAKASFELFRRLSSEKEKGITTEIVITKVVNILSSPPYSLNPGEVRSKLTPLTGVAGLRIPHKRLVQKALDIFVEITGLDFTDALSMAYMERDDIEEIYSFDKIKNQVRSIKRVEP